MGLGVDSAQLVELRSLVKAQETTNEWLAHISTQLEQLIQVSQGQPRQFYPPQAPWQQVPK